MLYIMRHGKTDWNALKKLQGRTDTLLNEEGLAMAKKAGVEYANVHFDVCYCSPLKRARKTAELVLEGRDVPIIADDRLIEMGFGECEGSLVDMSKSEEDFPINVFFNHPQDYKIPVKGGESLDELFERTGSFLREVAYPLVDAGQDVLIVGHGAMNSSIVTQVKKFDVKDFWRLGIENCKLMKLL